MVCFLFSFSFPNSLYLSLPFPKRWRANYLPGWVDWWVARARAQAPCIYMGVGVCRCTETAGPREG